MQERAITTYRAALSLFTQIEDPVGEANTLIALSVILLWQKHPVTELLHRALNLYEQVGDQSEQAQVLKLLAEVAQEGRDYALSYDYLERVISLYENLGQIQQQAETWILLGRVALPRDKNRDAAIIHFDKALALSISIKDLNGVQVALQALDKFARVSRDNLSIYQEIGALEQEIDALQSLGWKASHEKNFSLARELLQQALVLNDQLSENDIQRSSLLRSLGKVAEEEEDLATALVYYEHALPLVRQKLPFALADFLDRIAELHIHLNNLEKAIMTYTASAELREGYKKAHRLEKIADLERRSKNYVSARIALEDALKIYDTSPYHQHVSARIWWRLAELAADQNQDDEARRCFERAEAVLEGEQSDVLRMEVLWRRGRFEWSRGNQPLGCEYCRQALTLAAHMPYNKWAEPDIRYETWREEFEDMNCTIPFDTDTQPYDL